MTIQQYQKVYSANSTLHAAHVVSTLERAGIPASQANAKNGPYLDIFVPEPWTAQARQVLFAEPRSGEIYFIPARETV